MMKGVWTNVQDRWTSGLSQTMAGVYETSTIAISDVCEELSDVYTASMD